MGNREKEMPETLYTPEEAAARMRVTQRTVYTWLRQGALRGLKAGRAWRIRDGDMQAFLERHEQGGPKYENSSQG
jgi:excisionase family DNA binding protein